MNYTCQSYLLAMGVDIFRVLKVLMLTGNGRKLYELDPATQQSQVQQQAPSSSSMSSLYQSKQQLDNNVEQARNKVSLSEYVFGSVSIQSPADVYITRIHQLNDNTIMTSQAFDMNVLVSSDQQKSSKQLSNKKSTHTTSGQATRAQIDSTRQNTATRDVRVKKKPDTQLRATSLDQLSSNNSKHVDNALFVKRKFGLSLIWTTINNNNYDDSDKQKDSHLKFDAVQFVFQHLQAIDYYLNELRKNIVKSGPHLIYKQIHSYVLTCTKSLNLYANSLTLSNLPKYRFFDYADELVLIINELDSIGQLTVLAKILTFLHNRQNCRDVRLVLSSSSPTPFSCNGVKKYLMIRILFLLYCFLFDSNLKGILWKTKSLLSTTTATTPSIKTESTQTKRRISQNKTSNVTLVESKIKNYHDKDHTFNEQKNSFDVVDINWKLVHNSSLDINPEGASSSSSLKESSSSLKPLSTNCDNDRYDYEYPKLKDGNNDDDDDGYEDDDETICQSIDAYEVIKEPRTFITLPSYKCNFRLSDNSNLINEPMISSDFLPQCRLQCILVSRNANKEHLLSQQIVKASYDYPIVRINCDTWLVYLVLYCRCMLERIITNNSQL